MSRAAKGRELEETFAEWMKANLGYSLTKRNVLINGKVSKRPYEVDVHGRHYSRIWQALYLASFPGAVVVGYVSISYWSSWEFAAVCAAVILVAFIGRRKTRRDAWVECKNLQTTVRRAQVEKLQGAVHDVRENPRADWKPQRVMMVSGGGFDVDALGIARKHGIECYQRNGAGFERVKE